MDENSQRHNRRAHRGYPDRFSCPPPTTHSPLFSLKLGHTFLYHPNGCRKNLRWLQSSARWARRKATSDQPAHILCRLVANRSAQLRLHTFAPPIPPCPNLSRAPSSLSHSHRTFATPSLALIPRLANSPCTRSASHSVTPSFKHHWIFISHSSFKNSSFPAPRPSGDAQISAAFCAPFAKGVVQIGDNARDQTLVFSSLRVSICHLEIAFPLAPSAHFKLHSQFSISNF